jgi:hypothetical protein
MMQGSIGGIETHEQRMEESYWLTTHARIAAAMARQWGPEERSGPSWWGRIDAQLRPQIMDIGVMGAV